MDCYIRKQAFLRHLFSYSNYCYMSCQYTITKIITSVEKIGRYPSQTNNQLLSKIWTNIQHKMFFKQTRLKSKAHTYRHTLKMSVCKEQSLPCLVPWATFQGQQGKETLAEQLHGNNQRNQPWVSAPWDVPLVSHGLRDAWNTASGSEGKSCVPHTVTCFLHM